MKGCVSVCDRSPWGEWPQRARYTGGLLDLVGCSVSVPGNMCADDCPCPIFSQGEWGEEAGASEASRVLFLASSYLLTRKGKSKKIPQKQPCASCEGTGGRSRAGYSKGPWPGLLAQFLSSTQCPRQGWAHP